MSPRRIMPRSSVLLALAVTVPAHSAAAQDLASFYKSNPLQIVVGYGPGGGYDAYARVVARHMGKRLPGSPGVVVQNMPGAASMKAANYIYAIAPKDGSQIATFSRGLPMQPLLDNQGVQYDALKFGWIGSVASETSVTFAWAGTGFNTFEDARQKEMLVSASGAGADSATFPWIMNAVLGTKFRVITGYPDSNSTMLAVERGEVQGSAGTSWGTLTSSKPDWLAKNRITVLAQLGLESNPAIGKAPLILDFAKNAADRQVLEMIFARQSFAYPYTAPPGLPPERLAALRAAFNATMKDADFLADATKMGLEVSPVSGEELGALMEKLYKTPPEVVARAKAAIEAGKATAKK
ncbi:MAG: Bug family tripartite tricarboxylate transporter substrate binding protein [Beijerinckiaceae bacterium]